MNKIILYRKFLYWPLLLALQLLLAGNAAAVDFFEQNYRGWLWFEEKEQAQGQARMLEEQAANIPTKEQMQRAKSANEQFTEELEGLRHMMIRYPDNLNYIRLYKEKEKQMLDGAMTLSSNFAMVNFLNPDIADQLQAPQNIYGRNVAKAEKQTGELQILQSLAGKVELFIFRQENCAHCPVLEKHLYSFAKKYGFQVEAVSADNSKSSYFKTHNNPEIIKQLELTIMPTVIAVLKDSSRRFELVRGAVSIPDLEERALLLVQYLNNGQQQLVGQR